MSKLYTEIEKLQKETYAAFRTWETEMINFSRAFVPALQEAMGWPDQGFQRIDLESNQIPRDARMAPGGFTDARGYHFTVRISFGRSWLQVVFTARKVAEDTFEVKMGEDPAFTVNLKLPDALKPLADDLGGDIRQMVLDRELAVLTGYGSSSNS